MSGKSGASPRVLRYGFTCPDRAVFFVRWKKANMSIRGIAECRRRDNRGRERVARVWGGGVFTLFCHLLDSAISLVEDYPAEWRQLSFGFVK